MDDPDSVIDSIDPEEDFLRMLNRWRLYFVPRQPIVVDDHRWYPYPNTFRFSNTYRLSDPLPHPGAPRHRTWEEAFNEIYNHPDIITKAYDVNDPWQRTRASDEKKERRVVNRAVKQDERSARMQRDAARKAQQRRARRGH